MRLENELSIPFDKPRGHKAALVFTRYSIPKMELLKACFDKERLLIKRNSFIYIFKTVQIIIGAFITSTVFLRTEMNTRNEDDGAVYVGALIFSMIVNMFNGFAELSLTIARLPVFYKHRDLLFHPAWTFTVPSVLLGIPISILESSIWIAITYYTIGFAPEASRYKICMLYFIYVFGFSRNSEYEYVKIFADFSSIYCWYFCSNKWLLGCLGLLQESAGP